MSVSIQCLIERANLLGAHAMLRSQPIDQWCGVGTAQREEPKEVGVLLGLMEALRKGIDVVDHRTQHVERRCGPAQAYVPDEVKHAAQHCGQRPMLGEEHPNRLH